jgi:hypothetical protein
LPILLVALESHTVEGAFTFSHILYDLVELELLFSIFKDDVIAPIYPLKFEVITVTVLLTFFSGSL